MLKPPSASITDQDLDTLPWHLGITADVKLNGMRCMILNGRTYTTTGNEVANREMLKRLEPLLEQSRTQGLTFDMELYDSQIANDRKFKAHARLARQVGLLRTKWAALGDGHIAYVFDVLTDHEYLGLKATPYRARRERLLSLPSSPYIRPITSFDVSCADDVRRMFRQLTEAGGEGLVLKTLNVEPMKAGSTRLRGGFYKPSRATHNDCICWKLKAVDTADGMIVEVIEARNPRGIVGSFIVEWQSPETKQVARTGVGFGIGFDHEERQRLWDNRKDLVGKWVEFEHTPPSKEGTNHAFQGRVTQFRPDLDRTRGPVFRYSPTLDAKTVTSPNR